MKQYRPDTTCIHAGYTPGNGEPRVLPIVQSTTYTYDSSKEMGDLFDLKADGFFYTRLGNPTLDAVEKKLAALEGGVGALVTSSGQAATMMAVLNICHAGGHVVCSSAVYGGTFNLFYKTLHEMGIDCTFVSPNCTEDELNAAFRENTRCVFAETLTNPSLVVTDLEMFANAAHAHGVPCIVDNTFPTPINCRPFEFGVDIVTHSTTKYLDGHAVQLGGAIVDSGNFDWNNGKFPEFTEPDESYHGIVYAEHFGKAAYIAKARCHLMRDIGAQAAPMNAFYLNLGMETLALRMERHCSNAQKIAEFLEQDDRVAWVNYPGLESSPYHELAMKYMPHGTCGVISFGLYGGRKAAEIFMKHLKLGAIETHVADSHTCCLHPASSTHRQMTDAELDAAGVARKSNTVRHGGQRYNLLRYIFRQHAPRHEVRKHHAHRPRQRSSVGGHAFGSARRRHERHGSIRKRHGQSKADAFRSIRRIRQQHHLVHDYRRRMDCHKRRAYDRHAGFGGQHHIHGHSDGFARTESQHYAHDQRHRLHKARRSGV